MSTATHVAREHNPRHPSTIDMILAERVRAARIKAELSQGTLADRIGISFQQLQKYERGQNRLSVGRFLLLCKETGADPCELLAGLLEAAKEADAEPRDVIGNAATQQRRAA